MATTETDHIEDALSVEGGDEHCHLIRDGVRGRALCGSSVSHHPAGDGQDFLDPPDRCPSCGRPACPTCRAIWQTFRRSGAWEGPEAGP